MSAMPMGMPGWPLLARCTASMARARMALASSRRVGIGRLFRAQKDAYFRGTGLAGQERRGERGEARGAKTKTRQKLAPRLLLLFCLSPLPSRLSRYASPLTAGGTDAPATRSRPGKAAPPPAPAP